MTVGGLSQLKDDLSAISGVEKVIWGGDLLNSSLPPEMLPEDLHRFFYNEDGAALLIVRFSDSSAVSYTHLDVYKRQTLPGISPWIIFGSVFTDGSGIGTAESSACV